MDTKVDGRRARGLRTRDAIVSALIDLVAQGDASPTARRIAERAGVSVRSVYQHFTDVDGLFEQAGQRLYDWVSTQKVGIAPEAPRPDRIAALVESRTRILEALSPFSRAARVLEPGVTTLAQWRMTMLRDARGRLAEVFEPELARLAPEMREDLLSAMDLLTTWQAWDHLSQMGVSPSAARRVIAGALDRLLRTVDHGDGRGGG